ncbi:MAG: hypothetical protein A3G45_02810 [Candidatus Staskawiczbacteria bacterium RIFCSPLOWO2_12_FULL_37_15]|uniref:HD domain-containing protein n=1 Tax=Candidatus Staskawiczbacteria bacterium RIFCSPLOWO2_12_FULL_37_15 TaxID=1802218 RepID=A0A1G2IKM8_9BACT|nr:MAG: Metal dependent phosphohydrolase [Parcubacteria group bacterium GW2011_GWA2_37_10]OGZ75346.1 MAG: hypothetical protein A3G45_02810 [Candidatus Staskawiczbacteria bacterium RIFCSPLOWO2_12_FULL_37_15]
MEDNFQKIKKIVEKEENCTDAGHNMEHTLRVYNMCLKLAEDILGCDLEVIKFAALLHDIGGQKEIQDKSGKTDHALIGAKMAEPILKEMGVSDEKVKHIQDCIVSHRYKTENQPKTIEAKILFDADKLDALGAIGIARAFVWVGNNRAKIYYKPDNLDEYIKENLCDGKMNGRIQDKSKHSFQIEFETKIKFIVDKLYTKKAKKIGKERTEYFKKFLDRLEKEVKDKMYYNQDNSIKLKNYGKYRNNARKKHTKRFVFASFGNSYALLVSSKFRNLAVAIHKLLFAD